MDEQLEFVKLIASRLDSEDIAYMITGSMAAAVYATPRMTRDIDIVVELSQSDVGSIMSLFSPECYIDEDSVRSAIKEQGMFNIIHNDWMIKADFIVRKNEDYHEVEFERRKHIDIEGVRVFVVTAEDLILSKLVWGKDSQSELQFRDVHHIITSVAELDWNYINKWAVKLHVEDLLKRARGDA